MEKNQKILIILIFSILVITIGTCGFLVYKKDTTNISDNEKFKNEYESLNNLEYLNSISEYVKYIEVSIPDDNLYTYKSIEEIIDILKNDTGVIYIGNPENSNCRNLVEVLNSAAKEKNIDTIYYINIENYRSVYEIVDGNTELLIHGTNSYYDLVELLDEYLDYYTITDNNNKEYNTGEKIINSGTVVVVENGKILDFHEGTIEGLISSEKLNDESKDNLKNIYLSMLNKLK